MKTIEYTKKTGEIYPFNIENEIEDLLKLDDSKPSKRIIKTKKGKKAITALVDIEKNHNHSWYQELRNRASKSPNALALFYRGTKINFREMFEKADALAKSLSKVGIKAGDEIPICLSNTPELVYLMLAVNKIGAKLNSFGAQFDKNYLKQILEYCSHKIFIGSDDVYNDIRDIIEKDNFSKIVLFSLTDSLSKNFELLDEYEPELKRYYCYDEKVSKFKKVNPSIESFKEFLEYGEDNNEKIIDNNNLDTDFLITYTSGSTKIGLPKAIRHKNRSLIVSGRFHDSELSGNPNIKGLRGLAYPHPESNTDLITNISDNLMQLWSVALEPEYIEKQVLDCIFLNKPNYFNVSTSFLLEAAKQYLLDKRFHPNGKGRKIPWLLGVFAAGEGISKGEEKFCNKFLRESRAGSGVKIKGLSVPFVPVSIGGGDCEHGGIYYTLWKSIHETMLKPFLRKKEFGLMPEPYVQVSAFIHSGNGIYKECNYNEYGIIAANSATTMTGYKNNKEATLEMIITDDLDRDWVSCNVYGYIDEFGGVHIKGRMGNEITLSTGEKVLLFMIDDIISKDYKNILSCSTVRVLYNNQEILVVNIQLQPNSKISKENTIKSIEGKMQSVFSKNLTDKMLYRFYPIRSNIPITGSGKRSFRKLEEYGVKNTIKLNDANLIDGEMYLHKLSKVNNLIN